jgi:hypothetical protein
MTRKTTKGIYGKTMNLQATDPIVEDNKLPVMNDAVIKKAALPVAEKGKKPQLMENVKENTAAPSKKAVDEGKQMAAFAGIDKKAIQPHSGEQKARAVRKVAGEHYLVFRMHVQNGEISVTGAKRVDSTLERHEDLIQGGLTYEATLQESRLNIASIPDFGEQRSFPMPGDKGAKGHHITILPSFDFSVRIPGNLITEKDLPKVKVSLYRFKEHIPALKLNAAPLHQQYEKEVRMVAELKGITLDKMSKELKAEVKKVFVKQ